MIALERRLREENEELREEVRQLRELLLPEVKLPDEWGLTSQESRLFRSLLPQSERSYSAVCEAMRVGDEAPTVTLAKVVLHRVRKKAGPFGVRIRVIWGEGLALVDRLEWRRILAAGECRISPAPGLSREGYTNTEIRIDERQGMTARTIDTALASRLWAEGVPLTKIAEQAGSSHTSVSRLAKSRPDLFPPRPKLRTGPSPTYPADLLEQASALWREGRSGRKITAELDMALGMLDRMRAARPDLFPAHAKPIAVLHPAAALAKAQAGDRWSDDAIDRAAVLWSNPELSFADVARQAGCSGAALRSLAYRLRDRFPPRQGGRKHDVSTEDLDVVAGLWADGSSPKAIAQRMGWASPTRLRTLCDRHPERFPKRSPASVRPAPEKVASPHPVAARPAALPSAVRRAEPDENLDPEAESDARPASADAFRPLRNVAPVLVFECSGCVWPVHETGDPLRSTARHFCGAPKGSGPQPYCETHRRMAVRTEPAVVFSRRRPLRLGASA